MEQETKIVKDFSDKMLAKIVERHNRYAPLGWQTMDIKRLITLMEGEIAEMKESLVERNLDNAKREAIDIANYAMFLQEVINDTNN